MGGVDRVPGRRGRLAEPGVIAVVAAGGALGASARYGVARLVSVQAGGFPWATFWTNVSGSFALGVVVVVVVNAVPRNRQVRTFLATGFLGAYTTISTLAVESDLLVKDGHTAVAATYVLASLVAGLAAIAAGRAVGGRLGSSRLPRGGSES